MMIGVLLASNDASSEQRPFWIVLRRNDVGIKI